MRPAASVLAVLALGAVAAMAPAVAPVTATAGTARAVSASADPSSAGSSDEEDAPQQVAPQVVTSFADDRIDEASGLVVRDGRLFTVNDSGDGPFVYEVDPATGKTVGVTTFAAEDPEDVEALAAGPGAALWVGDIGDNARARSAVSVSRFVPPAGGGRVSAARFRLAYPDGAHDAETLLVHPRTGRVYLVTKSLTSGGGVYAAPRRLDPARVNPLRRVGRLPGLLTDGTFLPGGRRILLRGYAGAAVYAFPSLEQQLTFPLPPQQQGEAVAVGDDGRVYVTSEGRGAQVLAFELPTARQAGTDRPRARAERERREPAPVREPQPRAERGASGLLLAALGASLAAGALWWSLRAVRRRGRRRR